MEVVAQPPTVEVRPDEPSVFNQPVLRNSVRPRARSSCTSCSTTMGICRPFRTSPRGVSTSYPPQELGDSSRQRRSLQRISCRPTDYRGVPVQTGGLYDRGHLQGALADRAVLPGAQAEPAHQDLRGDLRQRSAHPDVDSTATGGSYLGQPCPRQTHFHPRSSAPCLCTVRRGRAEFRSTSGPPSPR